MLLLDVTRTWFHNGGPTATIICEESGTICALRYYIDWHHCAGAPCLVWFAWPLVTSRDLSRWEVILAQELDPRKQPEYFDKCYLGYSKIIIFLFFIRNKGKLWRRRKKLTGHYTKRDNLVLWNNLFLFEINFHSFWIRNKQHRTVCGDLCCRWAGHNNCTVHIPDRVVTRIDLKLKTKNQNSQNSLIFRIKMFGILWHIMNSWNSIQSWIVIYVVILGLEVNQNLSRYIVSTAKQFNFDNSKIKCFLYIFWYPIWGITATWWIKWQTLISRPYEKNSYI